MTVGSTLILFGISGVGKTTAAEALIRRVDGLQYFEASALLKSAHGQSGEILRTASPDRIAENQLALADALRQARRSLAGAPAIIAAHSVIDNDQTLVDLPLAIFAAIDPTAIAFLWSTPETIAARRAADTRERPIRSVQQLAEYQTRAEAVASAHAQALEVPFEPIEASDHEALVSFTVRTLRTA